MPDVNLLRDTKQPDEQRPKAPRQPDQPAMTDPSVEPKRGLGGALRSLLNRRPPVSSRPAPISAMTVERNEPARRVLNDKTTAAAPGLTALPDDDDFNVNLLTEDVVGSFNIRHRLIQLGLLAVGAIVVVVVSYIGLSVYEKSINQDVKKTKEQTIAVRSAIEDLQAPLEEAQVVNQRLQAVQQLVNRHIRWTKFFDRLEHYTLPQVSYGSTFTGALTTDVTLSATADSFDRLAQQYLVFKQAVAAGDFISDFSITGATKATVEKNVVVSFNVSLTLVPSIFDNELTTKSNQPTQP